MVSVRDDDSGGVLFTGWGRLWWVVAGVVVLVGQD